MAEKSHANLLKEKEIELLAKGLEQQNASHLKMDQDMLAHKHPESDQSGGAMNRLLKQRPDATSDSSGLTTSAVETASDMDSPGRSGS